MTFPGLEILKGYLIYLVLGSWTFT